MAMKDAYSTQELAILLCLVVSSIIRKARDENWGWRKRPGRGGGKEWLIASMPEATQASITAAEAKMLGASGALPEIRMPQGSASAWRRSSSAARRRG